MADPLHRSFLPQVVEDLRLLGREDDDLIDSALEAVADLAARRRTGKRLGERHVSGDLTGTQRLRFDLPNRRPERFRVVFRLLPDAPTAHTIEVISVGRRAGHEIYLEAIRRIEEAEE